MGLLKRFKKAFTLTELIIVMIVIAAIVGVSVKITKAKLDSIISYTYYSAYSTLRSISGEMIANDSGIAMIEDEGTTKFAFFIDNLTNKNQTASVTTKKSRTFLDKLFFLSANAQPTTQQCRVCYRLVAGICLPVPNYNQCMNEGLDFVCMDGQIPVNGVCVPQSGIPNCIVGTIWDGTKCAPVMSVCHDGKTWNGTECVSTETSPNEPEDPGSDPVVCPPTQLWDEIQGVCVNKIPSLPVSGEVFCNDLMNMINANSASCIGQNKAEVATAVAANDFSNLDPDLVLRNGMRLYNIKNDPSPIPMLAGTPESTSNGYTIYVDVDGVRGESILWEDVYPFYLTLSGRVIPAFRPGLESGGNSNAHLAVSVSYDTYPVGEDRQVNWMSPKSTTFQNAACMSGYVDAVGYCAGALPKQDICNDTSRDCQIVPIKPLKFF